LFFLIHAFHEGAATLVETPLRQRFLVKAAPGLPISRLEIGPAKAMITISAEPLFYSIGASRQGVAPAAAWQLLIADSETTINPWDACHAMMEPGLGVSSARAEFAEPISLRAGASATHGRSA
jgi:hypothetical protein